MRLLVFWESSQSTICFLNCQWTTGVVPGRNVMTPSSCVELIGSGTKAEPNTFWYEIWGFSGRECIDQSLKIVGPVPGQFRGFGIGRHCHRLTTKRIPCAIKRGIKHFHKMKHRLRLWMDGRPPSVSGSSPMCSSFCPEASLYFLRKFGKSPLSKNNSNSMARWVVAYDTSH